MKRIILLGILVATLTGCTDPKRATRVLNQQGFSDIQMTGYRFFICDKNDTFSTGFKAISPSGSDVTGAVCEGWLKGATVRFD
jgi:hypothetical protein